MQQLDLRSAFRHDEELPPWGGGEIAGRSLD